MGTTNPLRVKAIGSTKKNHRCALERGGTVAPAVEHVAAREELEMDAVGQFGPFQAEARQIFAQAIGVINRAALRAAGAE